LILSPFAAVAFVGLRHFAQRAETNRLYHLHARTLNPCVTTILLTCIPTAWRHVACLLVRNRKSNGDIADVNRAEAHYKRRSPMSVAKIIEISSESPKSFEDAIVNGIARASKTVHNIKSAWVKEQHVVIDNGKVVLYRVDLKVTFVLD